MPISNQISNSSSSRSMHKAFVRDIFEVAPHHYQLKMESAELAKSALPGQFVHILTHPNANNWGFDPFLRRAFSIMSVSEPDKSSINVLFRVEGRGTNVLSKTVKGDEIDIIGPLGKPFDLSPFGFDESVDNKSDEEMFHVKQGRPRAIVVGGGVGVPPLVYLSHSLNRSGVDVYAIIGARSAVEVIGRDELNASCNQVSITTDDGSQGHAGRVTDLLPNLISELTCQVAGKIILPVVYSCGPLPMLHAVAHVCAQNAVKCQVSLEENMPCGIGVCNGCVVRALQPFANAKQGEIEKIDSNEIVGNEWSKYQAYRRVCVEGPACWADEIDWEHQS